MEEKEFSKRVRIPKSIEVQIYSRDQWTCRYCGVEVFFSPALKALDQLNPGHGYYDKNGRPNYMTQVLRTRCAAIDHIHAVKNGGGNDISNLVCACWICNSKKGDKEKAPWIMKLNSVEKISTGNWDGLSGLLAHLLPSSPWVKYLKIEAQRQGKR